METTKDYKERALEEIKEAIKTRSFKIGQRIYAPLHATGYPTDVLKELQTKGFLARRGTLKKVLLENGLTYQHYKELRGGTNLYHHLIACFEVLKEII